MGSPNKMTTVTVIKHRSALHWQSRTVFSPDGHWYCGHVKFNCSADSHVFCPDCLKKVRKATQILFFSAMRHRKTAHCFSFGSREASPIYLSTKLLLAALGRRLFTNPWVFPHVHHIFWVESIWATTRKSYKRASESTQTLQSGPHDQIAGRFSSSTVSKTVRNHPINSFLTSRFVFVGSTYFNSSCVSQS